MWRRLLNPLICFAICRVASLSWTQLPADDCLNEAGRDAEKAIRYCSTAIDSGHLTGYELVHSLNNRGWAFYRSKDYDRAIQDYNRAIKLKPDHALAFNNRGLAYFDKGDNDQAIQNFDEAVRLRGNSPQVFYDRGRAYAAQAHFDRAIRDYTKVIRLRPDYTEAFKDRSEALMYKYESESACARSAARSKSSQVMRMLSPPVVPFVTENAITMRRYETSRKGSN